MTAGFWISTCINIQHNVNYSHYVKSFWFSSILCAYSVQGGDITEPFKVMGLNHSAWQYNNISSRLLLTIVLNIIERFKLPSSGLI